MADRFVPNREHQEADQLHRQHDRERKHDDRAREAEVGADAIRHNEREDDGEGADDQAGAGLQDDVNFAIDLEPMNDSEDQVGKKHPAERRRQNGNDVKLGIVPIISDCRGENGDKPRLRREGEEIMPQPPRPEHHEREEKAADRQKAEQRGWKRGEVCGQHGIKSAAY